MAPSPNDFDQNCVRDARAGSEAAWHRLVDRYSGLIYSVVRRYLPHASAEDRRDVYVEVLSTLYQGALESYDESTSFSTWLGVIARSRCMDHLRKRFGRRQSPQWLDELDDFDQSVYQLHFIDGLDLRQIVERMPGNDRSSSVQRVVKAMTRIDERLDRASRRRLAFELEARSAPEAHGRLLEYLAHARQSAEEQQLSSRADLALIEAEAQNLIDRLREALSRLDPQERQVLHLRFEKGLTAEAAAGEMGLGGARRAFTISDRAIGKLRRILAP